jgi:hypothetical protein
VLVYTTSMRRMQNLHFFEGGHYLVRLWLSLHANQVLMYDLEPRPPLCSWIDQTIIILKEWAMIGYAQYRSQ